VANATVEEVNPIDVSLVFSGNFRVETKDGIYFIDVSSMKPMSEPSKSMRSVTGVAKVTLLETSLGTTALNFRPENGEVLAEVMNAVFALRRFLRVNVTMGVYTA
jgi:hypothetical protein